MSEPAYPAGRRTTPAVRSSSLNTSGRNPRIIVLNVGIVLLAIVVVYLAFALINRQILEPPVNAAREGVQPGEIIQLDILNGSGLQGAASQCTSYLRARGFDVVEIRNYKTSDVDKSIVIDRIGIRANAEKVAYALGIPRSNVVQQLSPDYYVDVSVVIGKDFHSLKPSQ
jgi:hypothetical protein